MSFDEWMLDVWAVRDEQPMQDNNTKDHDPFIDTWGKEDI